MTVNKEWARRNKHILFYLEMQLTSQPLSLAYHTAHSNETCRACSTTQQPQQRNGESLPESAVGMPCTGSVLLDTNTLVALDTDATDAGYAF